MPASMKPTVAVATALLVAIVLGLAVVAPAPVDASTARPEFADDATHRTRISEAHAAMNRFHNAMGTHSAHRNNRKPVMTESCTFALAETIPQELDTTLPLLPGSMYTYEALVDIIDRAEKSISISAFYWNLQNNDTEGWGSRGRAVFESLVQAGQRGVPISIAQSGGQPATDSADLEKMGYATVRSLDFDKILGAGVLHTKFVVVDGLHFYVGSANMDWLSLAQVKEFGIYVRDCAALAGDLMKIWQVYFDIGATQEVPASFPAALETSINWDTPLSVRFNSTSTGDVFFGSAPKEFDPHGRTNDIDGLLNVINEANSTIVLAVMDYDPTSLYARPNFYWPVIDDALRNAVFNRGVAVRMLISNWTHSEPQTFDYLQSLVAFGAACEHYRSCTGSLDVNIFVVPPLSDGRVYPYSRVNHAKFMVTETRAFIHTSNWSADYFLNTGGVSFVTTDETIRSMSQQVFDRDWQSPYATPLAA